MQIFSTSTSSASSGLYASSMSKGVGGLISGLNTDQLVQQMTSLTRSRIAKQYQAKQQLIWKQDAYRSAISSLSKLQEKFFNVDSQYALSGQSFFNSTKASSSSDAVRVLGSTATSQASFSVDSVSNLAKAASKTGQTASRGIEFSLGASADMLNNTSMELEFDGVKKTVTLNGFSNDDTMAERQSQFQKLIDEQFKPNQPDEAGNSGHIIEVKAIGDLENGEFSLNAPGGRVTVRDTEKDSALGALGVQNNSTNTIGVGQTLEAIEHKLNGGTFSFATDADGNEKLAFSINGTDFEFNKTDTLTTVINKVNSSSAGVRMSYSQSTDTFRFVSTTTGADSEINLEGEFLQAISGGGYKNVAGENAVFEVNGQTLQRSSNIITIDGVKLELAATTNQAAEISVTQDTDKIVEGIKSFIDDYNSIVDTFYPMLLEKTNRDYPPLTDEQRKEMTENEIKLWEEKSKSGILRNDPIISNILSGMRTALNQRVEAAGLHLSQLGISTTATYKDGGKLQFDAGGEAKLREMIETRPDAVATFFNSTEKDANGKISGIGASIKEVLNTALKTTGEPKGTLVAMAGVASSSTDTNNSLSKQIAQIDDVITQLNSKLLKEENYYWRQFANLETSLAQLNSQASYLQSFFAS